MCTRNVYIMLHQIKRRGLFLWLSRVACVSFEHQLVGTFSFTCLSEPAIYNTWTIRSSLIPFFDVKHAHARARRQAFSSANELSECSWLWILQLVCVVYMSRWRLKLTAVLRAVTDGICLLVSLALSRAAAHTGSWAAVPSKIWTPPTRHRLALCLSHSWQQLLNIIIWAHGIAKLLLHYSKSIVRFLPILCRRLRWIVLYAIKWIN